MTKETFPSQSCSLGEPQIEGFGGSGYFDNVVIGIRMRFARTGLKLEVLQGYNDMIDIKKELKMPSRINCANIIKPVSRLWSK